MSIELSADFKNERIFIQIDEIQKSKNGKLTVHWTTKMNDPESGPGPIEIHTLPDDPTFLLLYLANEQPESLKVHYRFIRDTPHCEPVQLLAKVCYSKVSKQPYKDFSALQYSPRL